MKATKQQMEQFGHKMLVADVCRCGATVFEPVRNCPLKPRVQHCACQDGLDCSVDLTKTELARYEGSRGV